MLGFNNKTSSQHFTINYFRIISDHYRKIKNLNRIVNAVKLSNFPGKKLDFKIFNIRTKHHKIFVYFYNFFWNIQIVAPRTDLEYLITVNLGMNDNHPVVKLPIMLLKKYYGLFLFFSILMGIVNVPRLYMRGLECKGSLNLLL